MLAQKCYIANLLIRKWSFSDTTESYWIFKSMILLNIQWSVIPTEFSNLVCFTLIAGRRTMIEVTKSPKHDMDSRINFRIYTFSPMMIETWSILDFWLLTLFSLFKKHFELSWLLSSLRPVCIGKFHASFTKYYFLDNMITSSKHYLIVSCAAITVLWLYKFVFRFPNTSFVANHTQKVSANSLTKQLFELW